MEPWAGGGGPSACASGTPSVTEVVSGTCAGYAKPSWQQYGTVGVPNDGVRDVPDVSLFAAQGPWGHTYGFCFTDPSNGGGPCTSGGVPDQYGFGTSVASPIMAGVQALIDQTAHATEGNPNYNLYGLATQEFGSSGSSICNSTRGNAISGLCIFNDVTLGDSAVPCRADGGTSYDCYRPSGTNGVLSTSNSVDAPAFKAATGWDFATGIGSINVANLVKYFLQPYYGLTLTDTHDLNGDGFSDILWRATGGNVAVWLMDGSTVSQSASLGAVPNSFSIIGQHDFDGDGNADVVWRDGSGNVSMWFMNGATVASAAIVANVTSNWTLYGTGDLNNDGKGDLLWRDGTTGTVAVWFMNGATVASTTSFGAVPSNWTIVGATNGGILWRDSSGDIALWLLQSGAVTSSSSLGAVTSNFVVQGVGDFAGNGQIDVLWRDANTGAMSIWFTNGTKVLSAASLGTVSGTWSVAGVGDYNGDGRSDVLWIDSSGNLAVWLMNASSVASSPAIGNVGTGWSVQALNAE